jgi:hypothetical protein
MATRCHRNEFNHVLRRLVLSSQRNDDGMPDEREKAHHIDPNNRADGAQDTGYDCCTMLDEYLNSLVPQD